MGIKPMFTRNDIKRRVDAFLKEVENAQIEALEKLGEECVTHARELPPEIGFHDRTGNLRSSIGYSVYKNGEAVRDYYFKSEGKEKEEGKPDIGGDALKKAKDLADSVGKETKGITLVVTAGMNYAAALEANGAWKIKSKRSYDVLASAELLAERKLPKILSDLVEDINKSVK
jgi:hypothetical protein